MKWLLYLYPKKWRRRYGDELLYILENRKLSFKEVIDICFNAIDARVLHAVEWMMTSNQKLSDMMLQSILKRSLIFAIVIFIGFFGGYWLANHTPSILELPPKSLLLIGVGIGVFLGYVVGFVRGIMRVLDITEKKDVFLPTGNLKFEKMEQE